MGRLYVRQDAPSRPPRRDPLLHGLLRSRRSARPLFRHEDRATDRGARARAHRARWPALSGAVLLLPRALVSGAIHLCVPHVGCAGALSKYGCFAELAAAERPGLDYRVRTSGPVGSDVLIIAPHGGLIEAGTSEIAGLIAGEVYRLFSFEGLKPRGSNRDLHITSHRFDHPECVDLASRANVVLSVHGCLGATRIHIGGLDTQLADELAGSLRTAGFPI